MLVECNQNQIVHKAINITRWYLLLSILSPAKAEQASSVLLHYRAAYTKLLIVRLYMWICKHQEYVLRTNFLLITDTFLKFFSLMYLWFSPLASTCIKGESWFLGEHRCGVIWRWPVIWFRQRSVEAQPSRGSTVFTARICNSHGGIFFHTEKGQGLFPLKQKRY